MDQTSISEIGKIGKYPTLNLFRQLERLVDDFETVAREIDNLPDNADDDESAPLREIQWTIRGLINATPARTLSDFRLKALVFKKEAERDADFECDVLGSARELAKSLIDDALVMLCGRFTP